MKRPWKLLAIAMLLLSTLIAGPVASWAQDKRPQSQEVSEEDGEPVLLKHLPDYEKIRAAAVFVNDKTGLIRAVGSQPILEAVDFEAGTEAATAVYPEGRVVIVEYTNPQASTAVDAKVQQFLAAKPQPSVVYRRIGNYNAFVFDASNIDSANALLDQIKYQKTIQWLGEDPYLLKKVERYLVTTSRDIMISTVLVIVLGLAASVVVGLIAGFIFFRIRDQQRAHRTAFSDAGGLTRLNLDGLSE